MCQIARVPKLEGREGEQASFRASKRAIKQDLGALGALVCPLTRFCGGWVEEVSQRDGCIWVFQCRSTFVPPPMMMMTAATAAGPGAGPGAGAGQ